MKKKFIVYLTAILLVMFACFGQTVFAQDITSESSLNQVENEGLPNFKFKNVSLGQALQSAIPWIFAIAGALLLLYLLYGGIHLMVSGGDPKAVGEAKGKITNALIGFIIIFAAFWIVQLIARIFGLTPITNIFLSG